MAGQAGLRVVFRERSAGPDRDDHCREGSAGEGGEVRDRGGEGDVPGFRGRTLKIFFSFFPGP